MERTPPRCFTSILLRRAAPLALACLTFSVVQAASPEKSNPVEWNPKAAAAYLDDRAAWWATWPSSARDHNTFCVSCHTALPYSLARPALRKGLGEHALSVNERAIVDDVAKRVNIWTDAVPFYTDDKNGAGKSVESRSTESVLDALILTTYAQEDGSLKVTSRAALDHMMALQLTDGPQKGAWTWLQFHNEPWEGDDSQYWGSTLAAIAIARAPAEFRANPEIAQKTALLSEYLRGGMEKETLLNRLSVLWASAELPGLLTSGEQKKIIDALFAVQREDGGWSAANIINANWKRRDNTAIETRSDGYATGLVTFALEKAGVPKPEKHVQKALTWLGKNQDATEGFWTAYSVNKERDLKSERGRFMIDAATAYSVLALTAK
jgi:squalene-hopene/tetraprenyl-beta-curcumene cyclase